MARHLFERPVDDRYDKIVFMLAFFVGLVGILATRFFADQFVDPTKPLAPFDFLALLISISIIILYTIFILRTFDRASTSLDRAGDNAYYLGLLFTLVSLAYSLYKVVEIVGTSSVSQLDDTLSVRSSDRVLGLLPDFGLALGATITGIFCRVLVQQFRNDPADIETQARQELGRAVGELRASLLRAVADINSLSHSTNAATTEMVFHINKTLEEATSANASTMTRVGSKLEELAQETANQISKISGFSESVMREISAVSQSTNAATTEMTSQINRTLNEATAANASTMTRVGSKLEELAQETAKQNSKILGFSESVMREISAVVAGVNDQLSRLNIDPTEVQGRLGALSAELEKIRSELSRTSKAQENVAQELAAVSARIASSFSPDVASSVRSAADETLRRQEQVVSQLQGLAARVSETDQKFSNLTEDILKTGDELAQTRETSRQALGSTVVASSEYIESLADAAKKLRRSIDDNA